MYNQIKIHKKGKRQKNQPKKKGEENERGKKKEESYG